MNDERMAAASDQDARLMLAFREGSLEAFEELFSRHARAMVSFAYRFVRDRAVAEELAQEVFLRVHDAAWSYRPSARFSTWLYRIATNVCLNEVRRPRFRVRHDSLDAEGADPGAGPRLDVADRTPGPEDQVLRVDRFRVLKEALESLPEKQRLAFILNKYAELSYAEVAEVMRTSEKAVKSLIHRAKEGLAAKLRPLLEELW
jgi:RNA polymerase sigma-70 factor (ECF subfamily)